MSKNIEELKKEIFKNDRINTSKYYLIYIDVLGAKNLIDSEDSEFYLNCINHLYKESLATIKHLYEEISKIEINVRIFSDNIVIAIEQTENENSSIETIKQTLIIKIAAFFQVLALKYGMTTRGSIVLGDFFIDNNFVYGKALTRAYELENEIAIYPRIIINDSDVDTFMRSDYIRKILIKDNDNVYYINSFECYFNIAKIYKKDEITHLKNILWTKLGDSNSCKINQKIHWLVNMFNTFCKNNDLQKYILDLDNFPRFKDSFDKYFLNAKELNNAD